MQLGQSLGLKASPVVVDRYYLSQAYLVLDAAYGALKTGGTAAVHLDPVATWENQAVDGIASNAVQSTGSKQPFLLTPSAANLPVAHFPGVGSNFYSIPSASSSDTDALTDFTLEAKGVTLANWASADMGLISKWTTPNRGYRLGLLSSGHPVVYISFNGSTTTTFDCSAATGLSAGATADIMAIKTGSVIRFYVNGVQLGADETGVSTAATYSNASVIRLGMGYNTTGRPLEGKMTRARIWDSAVASPASPTETPVMDVNFEVDATHGASSFTATIGGTVTVTTSGDNPCRVIGYPVVRNDGSDDFMPGTFDPELASGRLFVVCSVLGGGGEAHARVFSTSEDGASVTTCTSGAGLFIREVSTANWRTYHNSAEALSQSGKYAGRFLAQVDFADGAQSSKSNNTNEQTATADWSGLSSNEYALGAGSDNGAYSSAVDIEFIGLYPASMTDANAASLVATLNRRFDIY